MLDGLVVYIGLSTDGGTTYDILKNQINMCK